MASSESRHRNTTKVCFTTVVPLLLECTLYRRVELAMYPGLESKECFLLKSDNGAKARKHGVDNSLKSN